MKGAHYHTHPGEGHSHPHIHSEDHNHHGPAFGRKQVYEVEEPSLEYLLKKSIQAEEAKRGND